MKTPLQAFCGRLNSSATSADYLFGCVLLAVIFLLVSAFLPVQQYSAAGTIQHAEFIHPVRRN